MQRTGIEQRHIAADDETTSMLGIKAAEAALADAGLEADGHRPHRLRDLDAGLHLPVHGDVDPGRARHPPRRRLRPAGRVHRLRLRGGDADKFLASGSHKRALVIGAETFSRILDWEDRTTCVLFGDGAGAIVLEAQEGEGTPADRGVLTSHLRSDGRHRDKLYVDGGPGSTKTTGVLKMEGREVFRFAVGMVTDVIRDAFEATGTTAEDLDWFVPHQANKRIITASADKLGIAPEKVVITVDKHGNTSAASIPLALDVGQARRADQGGRSRDDRGHRRRLHLGHRR